MKGTLPATALPENGQAALFFPARLVGRQARVALERGSSWRILALFSRGFYGQARQGDLVFFGSLSLEPGPLNLLCDFPARWDWQVAGLQTGAEVRRDGETLRIDGRFGFPLGSVRQWRASHPAGAWDKEEIAGRMARLSREAARRKLTEGFGPLVSRFAEGEGDPCGARAPLILAAGPGIEVLRKVLEDWLAGSSAPLAGADGEAVAGLIGLGPGLTPSGDDLLGGVMIALHALGRKEIAGQLAQIVLPRARVRTGAVSRAHLACAAEGEGSAALHDALSALCTGKDDGRSGWLARIDSIGATSGWDALAGVILAMEAWLSTSPASAREGKSFLCGPWSAGR
jgi:hypothetical protein